MKTFNEIMNLENDVTVVAYMKCRNELEKMIASGKYEDEILDIYKHALGVKSKQVLELVAIALQNELDRLDDLRKDGE